MSKPFKILVGDTDTPQARVPKSADQTYLAPVTLDDSSNVQIAFEIDVDVQQSGTAGYNALLIDVTNTSNGSGDKLPIHVKDDDVTKFSVDSEGNVEANNLATIATGTFTPTIQDSSLSDAEGQTYTWQRGFYIKIGKLVFINIGLNVSSIGTLTGAERMKIGGLPFANSSTSNNHASVTIGNMSNTGSSSSPAAGVIFAGNSHIDMYEWNNAGLSTNNLTITEFGGSGEVILSATYYTD
jgi:hypothetical protein